MPIIISTNDTRLSNSEAHTPETFHESLYQAVGSLKHDFRNRNLIRLVVSLVSGKSVLDIGCGTGSLVAALQREGKEAIGLEPNENLVDIASYLNPTATVLSGSGEHAPELGRHFDTITMIDVLEHISDDMGQLELLHQCLKPEGRLVLVVPAHERLFGQRDRVNGHFRRYRRHQLVWKLRATGFEVETVRSWNLIGVLPYWCSERILNRPLEVRLRQDVNAGAWVNSLRAAIDFWMRCVENKLSFGVGLSLVCVARRASHGNDALSRH